MKNELNEVRCPNTRWKGNTNNISCNALLGKVSGPTTGEFWCRKCKIIFNFVMNADGEVSYFGYEPSEVVKRPKTPEDRLFDLLNQQN